jgi:endonuclease/exonuclease/phosphatase family metal-dependent hydrolase
MSFRCPPPSADERECHFPRAARGTHLLAALPFLLCAVLTACPGPRTNPDAGVDAGDPEDASVEDSGTPADAGEIDAGTDAGQDAGSDAGEDAGIDAGPSLRCSPRDAGIADGGLLRIIAANLSSGNLQSWDPGHGARILQGLKPDVVLIQEWNIGNKTDEDRRAWVDATFGPDFCFQVEDGVQIPNGVISRYPILSAGNWVDSQVSNRSFVWARLDVPGSRDLWAISLHLLTSNPGQRTLEATDLISKINQVIPPADLLVLGGDLNTSNRTETTIGTLAQVVRTTGPHPADGNGNQNTNTNRNNPYDWVLADADLAALQVPVAIADGGLFDAGLVFDSRVFSPLGDVAPVLATDSSAVNMQHMAVVKDFLLP